MRENFTDEDDTIDLVIDIDDRRYRMTILTSDHKEVTKVLNEGYYVWNL